MQENTYICAGRIMLNGGGANALPLHNRKGAPIVYDDVEHPRDLK